MKVWLRSPAHRRPRTRTDTNLAVASHQWHGEMQLRRMAVVAADAADVALTCERFGPADSRQGVAMSKALATSYGHGLFGPRTA